MNSLEIGEAYLGALQKKDLETIRSLVHPELNFKTPLMEFFNREDFLEATKRIMGVHQGIIVKSRFSSQDQAIFTYEIKFPDPIGVSRTANLMTIADSKIKSIELFYDARPFEKMIAAQK